MVKFIYGQLCAAHIDVWERRCVPFMLSRMVKQLVAAGLALAFMFTSALCLAVPNDKSDDTLPSVPDAESGTEHAAGVGVDYYGHADNASFSGIGSDMTTKLKDMLSASVSSEYGIGIRFDMDEAMEEYDFSSDDLSGLTIGIDPGHQLIADDELCLLYTSPSPRD